MPGPITISAITTTSIDLAWAASTDNVGVTQYSGSQGYLDVGWSYPTSTNSIQFNNLRPSGTYTFRVAALDAAGNRSASNASVRVTMPPGDSQAPTIPGQPVASNITQTGLKLTWARSVENIQLRSYEVFLVTSAGNTFVRDVNQIPVGPNETLIGGLAPGTTYTFAVRALDEARNYSAFSPTVTVTTLP